MSDTIWYMSFSVWLTSLSIIIFSFFFFFHLFFISWRLITLQYCSGFCHKLTWISHGFTCVPHPDPPSHLPLHPIPLGLPSAPGPSTCHLLFYIRPIVWCLAVIPGISWVLDHGRFTVKERDMQSDIAT